ncbi:hypothetical protein IR196_06925 [Brucella anthropi]|nr:hypothetical protein [Brucella anthropi]QPA25813.1 hypothetical protein IR196_06925 [Brucella anthropi]
MKTVASHQAGLIACRYPAVVQEAGILIASSRRDSPAQVKGIKRHG